MMAMIAEGARFSLLALEGTAINPARHFSSTSQTTSFCIVDRAWAYREIWRDYSQSGGGNRDNKVNRRIYALAKLAELEAEYANAAD